MLFPVLALDNAMSKEIVGVEFANHARNLGRLMQNSRVALACSHRADRARGGAAHHMAIWALFGKHCGGSKELSRDQERTTATMRPDGFQITIESRWYALDRSD